MRNVSIVKHFRRILLCKCERPIYGRYLDVLLLASALKSSFPRYGRRTESSRILNGSLNTEGQIMIKSILKMCIVIINLHFIIRYIILSLYL